MESLSIYSPKNSDLDPWDSKNSLDETHHEEGINAGYTDGLVSGKEEGKQVGLTLGFEVGAELGYYQGCLDVWNSAIKIDPHCFSSRMQKKIKEMTELIKTYPVFDPENENVQDIMDARIKKEDSALRLKIKPIASKFKMKLENHVKSLDIEE
ncbi:hypothetical protein C5167_025706 [Papaver somniferum]|uniref:Essential protein Yae1 N-terminal domain-containing protein n=1 Tax=Papaver somniferum TaxID=3469 RepID=A0A4Y7JW20_PAPSO|nr:oral cancer-overexpressed protein 1-like [Papaver somniferum]RZC63958.1 hypothetical protein C5167_025706 [Papaver somniferum]